MTTHALFCEISESWQESHLRQRMNASDHQLHPVFTEQPLQSVPPDERNDVNVVSLFINSDVNEEQLQSMPELQLLTTRSTGFDHIPLELCADQNVAVANVPTYGENTVAEHTFALLLNLSRRVYEVMEQTHRGNFSFGGVRGCDLRGKTIGVIGTGRIGKHVIKMARGFGMNILAYDVEPDAFTAEFLDFEYVSLETLLGSSDIVSLHVPLNEHTHHLLDREELEQCQNHTIIINTARGGLINTEVLHEMLRKDKLGGAGLDVIEGEEMILSDSELNEKEFSREKLEQLVQNSRLLQRDDVIFTPHMAYNSREAVERILDTTIDNIETFLSGHPKNLVNKPRESGG